MTSLTVPHVADRTPLTSAPTWCQTWQVPARAHHTHLYQDAAAMALPVQGHCSGTASPYRLSPASLLLPLPALLQEEGPGRGLHQALSSCCTWQCIPAEGKPSASLLFRTGAHSTATLHRPNSFLTVPTQPRLQICSQDIPCAEFGSEMPSALQSHWSYRT